MTVLQILIAVAAGVAIFWIIRRILMLLATPPPEIDPDDIVAVRHHYRCSICGTELTVTAASLTETEAPRHCREEMTLTWQGE